MKLVSQVSFLGRIAVFCAVAVWLTSAFAGQNPADSGQAASATVVQPSAPPPSTYTDLHDFNGGAGDPTYFDSGRLAQGRNGKFYAESRNGGTSGDGTVFTVTTSGTVTIFHSLSATDGASPQGGITLGTDGNFRGNAVSGGTANLGTVFKITPAGALSVLHNFTNTGDGLNPFNALVMDTHGNFYGTTNVPSPPATIYKVSPSGIFSTIHTLSSSEGYEGGQLNLGSNGKIYGAMNLGGANGYGTAFSVTTGGTFTVLHNFNNTDGADAAEGMVQAGNGKFYGATTLGGSSNAGVIYSLTSSGAYTMLYSLNGSTDGYEPHGQLIVGIDGKLYGVTNSGGSSGCGTIFRVTLSGTFTPLYNFDNTHGCNPQEQVIEGTDGTLYGLTQNGGAHGNGVFYSFSILGLHPFVSLVSTVGKEGAKIGILGQGFSGSSVVEFGGIPATAVTRQGSTFLSATVPPGALTGPVMVTTGATTLTSAETFKVTPTITSFSPPSGPVGTPVTITGTGLTQTTKVTFNGTTATFTVDSDTQVSTTVPTGATTGPIAVTTPGGSAKSATSFTVD
jgi:uncharacterized repeat protein (TIGR03803 family)